MAGCQPRALQAVREVMTADPDHYQVLRSHGDNHVFVLCYADRFYDDGRACHTAARKAAIALAKVANTGALGMCPTAAPTAASVAVQNSAGNSVTMSVPTISQAASPS